ncbi:hypothetical protein [Acinetobacter baumannii]|uniref:hypothetical protein n=1 Tax=Acinetobacter baumannii TaxID=470 RepID=UPI00344D1F26
MSVPVQTPSKEYIANGTTTAFPLDFNCDKAEYLIVTLNGEEAPVGSWTLANDTVTFNVAPLNGVVVNLQRNTPFQRTTNYQLYDNSFRPSAVNKDFDLIWWKLQELGVADWILGNRISALKNYVDRKDDELKAYLMEEIRKQGVALDQLDEYYNYLMQQLAQVAIDRGWAASFIVSADGSTQQEINDRIGNTWYAKPLGYELNARIMLDNGDIVKNTTPNNTTNPNTDMSKWAFTEHLIFRSLSEMLAYQNPKSGQVAHMLSFHAPNFALLKPRDGGGFFIYDESKSNDNNGGTIFNGWVRQYSGDVDISWFGAVQGADASPFIESALKISKSIVIRGNYTLETICGIPKQNNYANNVIVIRGENQATLTVNCPSGAVFTSADAKLNPDSTSNLFTAKIDVSGINFIGTTVANSVIFNGDRLYNMDIHHNNFKGNVTIVKAYVKREVNRQYTQSTSIFKNHLANVYRVIEADKAYNFDFSYNMCEACVGGMYIGVDAPWDPNAISLTIHRNLWEGGGMLLKTNGGIVAGSVSKNYFESNVYHDVLTDKCLIHINRTGTGSGYSSGLTFENNLFSGNSSIIDYVDVRFANQSTESLGNSKIATTKAPVFIGNWSNSARITNLDSAVLINNRCENRATMKNAYSPQEGRVSFISGYKEKVLADILNTKTLSIMTFDTTACLASGVANSNFKATLDISMYFKTSGGVNTASATCKVDIFAFTPFGITSPVKTHLKAVMSNFMQSTSADKITSTVGMFAPFANQTINLVDNGDGTYILQLSDFTNFSTPSWGNATSVRIEYTLSGTLIASQSSSYSTLNLMVVG